MPSGNPEDEGYHDDSDESDFAASQRPIFLCALSRLIPYLVRCPNNCQGSVKRPNCLESRDRLVSRFLSLVTETVSAGLSRGAASPSIPLRTECRLYCWRTQPVQ